MELNPTQTGYTSLDVQNSGQATKVDFVASWRQELKFLLGFSKSFNLVSFLAWREIIYANIGSTGNISRLEVLIFTICSSKTFLSCLELFLSEVSHASEACFGCKLVFLACRLTVIYTISRQAAVKQPKGSSALMRSPSCAWTEFYI